MTRIITTDKDKLATRKINNCWIPIATLILAWLISCTPLHLWLDNWAHDQQQQLVAQDYYFTDSVVLDIDDESLQRLKTHFGTWPYSRDVYAMILDYLSEQGAANVVFDIMFAESRPRDEIFKKSIQQHHKAIFIAAAPARAMPISPEIYDRLKTLSWKATGNPPAITLNSMILPRFDIVGTTKDQAKIGVVTATSDHDGVLRRLPMLYKVNDSLLPSLPLRILASEEENPQVHFNDYTGKLQFDNLSWSIDQRGTMQLYYPRNANSILALPFFEVAEVALGLNQINAANFFQDKTVFIGSTAYLSDRVNTPRGSMSGTYLLAIAYETMKQGLSINPNKTSWSILLIIIALLPTIIISFRNRFTMLEILVYPIVGVSAVVMISFCLQIFYHQKNSLVFPAEIILLGFLFTLVHHQIIVKAENKLLEQRNIILALTANTDLLTNLYNRRAFLDLYNNELKRFSRYHDNLLTIAIIDLDFFKNVNDTFGHDVGDDVLKRFAQILKCNIRSIDVPCRWGGEEFAVILPETTMQNAMILLNRIRTAISQEQFPPHADDLVVTISIGVTTVASENTKLEHVMKQADTALYEAKRSGRNRICTYKGDSV